MTLVVGDPHSFVCFFCCCKGNGSKITNQQPSGTQSCAAPQQAGTSDKPQVRVGFCNLVASSPFHPTLVRSAETPPSTKTGSDLEKDPTFTHWWKRKADPDCVYISAGFVTAQSRQARTFYRCLCRSTFQWVGIYEQLEQAGGKLHINFTASVEGYRHGISS